MRIKTLLPIIFFLLSALALQCTPTMAAQDVTMPYVLRSMLARAQREVEKKSYKRAEKILTEYINDKSNKPNYLVYYLLGNVFYLENRKKDAYKAYREACKLNPSYQPACINLAKMNYDAGKYGEAGDLFLRAYRCSGEPDPEILYEAGVAYFQGKLYRNAKKVLATLLKETKDKKEKYVRLFVHTCIELKEWDTAERYMLSLIEKNRINASYWKLLARIRLGKGDYRAAAGSLEVAYRLDPPEAGRWKELAELYLYMGVPLKAARCLEKAYAPYPSPRQLDEIARAYARANRLKKAVSCYENALKKEPKEARYLEVAKLYYQNGMWKEAAEMLKKCIQIDRANGFAHLLLGYCAWQLNDVGLAMKELSEASKCKRYRHQALTARDMLKETITCCDRHQQ